MSRVALVWLRQDLRLADNPALTAAVQECDRILPVFIDEPHGHAGFPRSAGKASFVWLHHSLLSLRQQLEARGSRLLIYQGDAVDCLPALVQQAQVTHVFWNRRYYPQGISTDTEIKRILTAAGCQVKSFNGSLLSEPWQTLKQDGTPYRVFTAFWKAKRKQGLDSMPLAAPERLPAPAQWPVSLQLADLGFLPAIRWDQKMVGYWQMGEVAAHKQLSAFLESRVGDYQQARDLPAQTGTSRLSPHLHFGEISPRQVLYQAGQALDQHPEAARGIHCFLAEIGWREFAYYLLYHFPQTLERPLNPRFEAFVWREDYEADLKRWQQGMTGFPIIDAGMRELWATGWMHNRVRMIVASLLTKNLLVPWQCGEQWFRDTLVDADLASNTLGWQWVAGCGADAAPYFRIFNPVLQSEKFDPQGEYIRRWVPELRSCTGKAIHQPRGQGDKIRGYPLPLVDLKASRERALEQFQQIKK